MTIEQLVTDEDIFEVFKNTNFYDTSPRQIISATLRKREQGCNSGRKSTQCCVDLGLMIKYTSKASEDQYISTYELSITGKKYLELLKEAENENKAD